MKWRVYFEEYVGDGYYLKWYEECATRDEAEVLVATSGMGVIKEVCA